jgi:hypothetical protein
MITDDYEDDAIIPAGGLPPTDKEPQAPPTTKIKVGEKEMDPADLAKSYLELQKKLGEQGNELGKFRGQSEILLRQVADMQERMAGQQRGEQKQNQPPDFEAQKAAITKAIDSGEISVEEGNAKMWDLMDERATMKAQKIAEKAVMEARSAFEKAQQDREAEQIKAKFLDKNKDFLAFRDSEDAARIKAEDPVHDDVSAYYAWIAMKAVQQFNELSDRVQSGAKPKGPVVDKPGSAIRTQNLSKPRSFEERRQAALAAANATGR